jgi:hypothetical protein
MRRLVFAAIVAMLAISVTAQAAITLYTPAAGDATYAWNSKYGAYGYGTGGNEMGVGLYFGAPYGNDYTISIFEIPIAELAGISLASANLEVESLGFGTGYWYGSASIGWLDTGTRTLSGDVVADGLGPVAGCPGGWQIYNSDITDVPGLKSFDVLTCLQADIAAGRSYSTFVMSGSRDTYGSIRTAESGCGPRIVASPVPEPGTLAIMGASLAGLLLKRRRK